MASENQSSFFETFIPFILSLNPTNPIQETQNQAGPRDRVVFINPFARTMVVIEASSSIGGGDSSAELESLFGDLFSGKSNQRPASKASIDAMPSVEIVLNGENSDDQCAVCLENWEDGETAKVMPCKHRFHGECIEKWLKISGSCPVCRHEMPVDENDDAGKNDGSELREILMRFGVENSNSSSDRQEI